MKGYYVNIQMKLLERLCIKVGRGQGDRDVCVRTWDLGTSSIGRGDAGTSKTGTQGTRDDYRNSRR